MQILVVRNDKIGDFMLAWPVFSLLKQHWPEVTLSALVPRYTAELAQLCPWIDQVVLDEGEGAVALAKKLRRHRFDAVLTLFSTSRVAIAASLARIPYRLAPATKVAQLFYNHRLVQRRSRSQKPEYAYNLDLAYQLLDDFDRLVLRRSTEESPGDYLPPEITRPLLRPQGDQQRSAYAQKHNLDAGALWVVIHPGSGGSANNLSTEQYSRLACHLRSSHALQFIITAGPGEEPAAKEVATGILRKGGDAVVQRPAEISGLIALLSWADLYISGSTGPLHIAAALNRPTAAFYPRHRSATPLRWQGLNAPERRIAFTPPPEGEEQDVSSIDVEEAARGISDFLQQQTAAQNH
jgi:ADP-heptose:LPS heptosyltransferase